MVRLPVQGPPGGGLAPVPAAVKARHKRQNRLLVALIVMMVLPITFYFGSDRWAESIVLDWSAQPTMPYNQTTTIPIEAAGEYIVWTVPARADCEVSFDSQPIIGRAASTMASSGTGFYPSLAFDAPQAGDYQVICHSDHRDGFAMVSTQIPTATAGLILLAGIGLAMVSAGVGLGLLIHALTQNNKEKRAEAYAAQLVSSQRHPGWPPGSHAPGAPAPQPHAGPQPGPARPHPSSQRPAPPSPASGPQPPVTWPPTPGAQPTRPATPPPPPRG